MKDIPLFLLIELKGSGAGTLEAACAGRAVLGPGRSRAARSASPLAIMAEPQMKNTSNNYLIKTNTSKLEGGLDLDLAKILILTNETKKTGDQRSENEQKVNLLELAEKRVLPRAEKKKEEEEGRRRRRKRRKEDEEEEEEKKTKKKKKKKKKRRRRRRRKEEEEEDDDEEEEEEERKLMREERSRK